MSFVETNRTHNTNKGQLAYEQGSDGPRKGQRVYKC